MEKNQLTNSSVFTLLFTSSLPSLISVLPLSLFFLFPPLLPANLFYLPLTFLLKYFPPPSFPAPCLPSSSHSLFSSSSSSAADCCPSYLCSRLGMFFLLMTSIPPPHTQPLHHFLFSCLGCPPARVSYLSLPTHLDNCRRFIQGGGLGWRQGWAMISYRAAGHGEAFLGCLMFFFGWGSLSISLSTQNSCWGGDEVKLLLSAVKIQLFPKL